jgi:succinate dehydrogenase/fumarate reductase cytochrome b subunit
VCVCVCVCVCVSVALVIHHAIGLRHIVLATSYLVVTYFSPLTHKKRGFRKSLLNIKCVLIFVQVLSEIFLRLRRIYRGIDIINVRRCECEVKYCRLFLSDFNGI